MKIHILGVCGTFMGGIAQLAVALGHKVAGSDTNFYEPMASQLAAAGVKCYDGYDSTCKSRSADLYIIGNVISRGNPFFEDILASKCKFCSAPAWLDQSVLSCCDQVVAVAGTHGKTTTAAMVVHMLDRAGWDPSYLVGGVLGPSGRSANWGTKSVMVVEADEYDTALFDKRPKFVHYWSNVTILNNIEFDHADIYRDLQDVQRQFALLPRYLKPHGTLVANWAYTTVQDVVKNQDWYAIERFNDAAGWHWQDGSIVTPTGEHQPVTIPGLPGDHNRSNTLAAVAACAQLGVSPATAIASLADFTLPARRLEEVGSSGGVTIIDDFAHHPTAIALTIAAVAEAYPSRRIVVLFEPRSNTMQAGHWQAELARA